MDTDRQRIEQEFERRIEETVLESMRFNYIPTLFLGMLRERGAIATATRLIRDTTIQKGLVILKRNGKLHLAIESVIIESAEFQRLFPPDIVDRARKTLAFVREKTVEELESIFPSKPYGR